MGSKGRGHQDWKFSYLGRRKRRFDEFNNQLTRYRKMNIDEMFFEYMELKAEYEHKKNVLLFVVISVSISVLVNVWNKSNLFLQRVFEYAGASGDNGRQIVIVGVFIGFVVVIIVTFVILFVFLELLKDMKMLQKKIMAIEYVKCEKPSKIKGFKIYKVVKM